MGFAITKRPVQLVNGQQSKWCPAHQPVVFEVERRDVEIVRVQALFSGGQISGTRLTINAPLSYWNVKKYDIVAIFIPYKITYTIVNILSDTVFDVNITVGSQIPNIGHTLNFINAQYYLEMRVVYTENNLQYKKLGTLKAKTDSNGIAVFNVQDLLSTKTINQNNFLYNKINEGQWGEGTRFNIQMRQWFFVQITYLNNQTNTYTPLVDSNVFYYTNSANQIQNQYGYNMGEYVPTYDAGRTDKAKFQSVFKKPTYFVGYPFSLNFIYSDNMRNYQVYKNEETKDINGNIIATISTNLDIAHRELGNRLMLDGSYTSNIKTLDVYLSTDGVQILSNNYFDEEYLDGTIAPPLINNSYDDTLIGLVQ